eukprot:2952367-Rhodomonas_salina.2
MKTGQCWQRLLWAPHSRPAHEGGGKSRRNRDPGWNKRGLPAAAAAATDSSEPLSATPPAPRVPLALAQPATPPQQLLHPYDCLKRGLSFTGTPPSTSS